MDSLGCKIGMVPLGTENKELVITDGGRVGIGTGHDLRFPNLTMKCQTCGTQLYACRIGNYHCANKKHWYCAKCDPNVGLGCSDPCFELKIE